MDINDVHQQMQDAIQTARLTKPVWQGLLDAFKRRRNLQSNEPVDNQELVQDLLRENDRDTVESLELTTEAASHILGPGFESEDVLDPTWQKRWIAGEPEGSPFAIHEIAVYPCECRGTDDIIKINMPRTGLSPRVRGNQRHPPRLTHQVRSIPASAGEPGPYPLRRRSNRVYPRECGGTGSFGEHNCPCSGLSPRVRGNLLLDGWNV